MLRNLSAALAGGLFALGLVVADMSDTTRVLGWRDVFGDWDPTLAFVLAGAVLPMAVAWAVAGRMGRTALASPLPERRGPVADPALVTGSLVFGAGWGLSGLCPGPAMAALGLGGWPSALFLVATMAVMVATPLIRGRLIRPATA